MTYPFTAFDYSNLYDRVFQPDYPGYKPSVTEIPNGDGKADTEKRYATEQCPKGHALVQPNVTPAGNCRACIKLCNDSRKEYRAEYKAANAEAMREAVHTWYSKKNKERARNNARAWRAKNRETVRAQGRKKAWKRNGVAEPTAEMRSGECPICLRNVALVWDHDHATGETRGWICNCCNRALGQLGDTFQAVLRAAEYLRPKS